MSESRLDSNTPASPGESLAKELHEHGNTLLAQVMEKPNDEGSLNKLKADIDSYLKALACYPLLHQSRRKVSQNLAACYTILFRFTGNIADLEEAIFAQRQLLEEAINSNADRFPSLTNLGISLALRYRHIHSVEDITEAISLHRQGLGCSTPENPSYQICLQHLTDELSTRFEDSGAFEDVDEIINLQRHLLSHISVTDDDRRRSILRQIGYHLYLRFEQSRISDDLDESIKFLNEALALGETGSNGQTLNTLAAGYLARFNHVGSVDDLKSGVGLFRRALSRSNSNDDSYSSLLSNLGTSLYTLYTTVGDPDYLDESIIVIEKALSYQPPGHSKRVTTLATLANSVIDRFVDFGDLQSIDTAISLNQEALEASIEMADRLMVLVSLAFGLYIRHAHTGNRLDIDSAINHVREAAGIAKSTVSMKNMDKILDGLAMYLCSRFQSLGDVADLQESIVKHREALVLRPLGNPARYTSLAGLATALIVRYEHTGNMDDLEESIALKREAIAACSNNLSQRFTLLDSLALALSTRAEKLGRTQDLDETITLHQRAISLCPPNHIHKAAFFNNLATAFYARYNHTKDIQDLNDSIAANLEALALRPVGSPLRWKSLNNTAGAFNMRFEILGDSEDLWHSIELFQECFSYTTPEQPDFSMVILNLAAVLYNRFELTRDLDDLNNLIKLYFVANKHLHGAHPSVSDVNFQIGMKLLIICRLYPRSDREELEEDAFKALEAATIHPTASPKTRFTNALGWEEVARRHGHKTHLQAYTHCLTALEHCLFFAPSVESQQMLLSNVVPRSLASDAASLAISEGRIDHAVELLEQGRAILWSRLRGYRHSLEEIHNVAPELAERLENVTAILESYSLHVDLQGMMTNEIFQPDTVGSHRALCDERENIINDIRKLEGFSNFLKAVPFSSLQCAANEGPVIVIIVSKYGTNAIIVRDKGSPISIPLPSVSLESLEELESLFNEAKGMHSQQRIVQVLRILWKDIVHPIVKRLVSLGIRPGSRIWWCPTSVLCQFPLHAAGPYRKSGKNLPDIFVSSYTPSLIALMRARSDLVHLSRRVGNPGILVMGQAETLPAVRDEVNTLRKMGDFVTPILDSEATREAVISHLQSHKWAHFACHGFQDPAQPFQSFFQLHNEQPLTLLDLVQARLPNAEFAFLSACHTAAGDIEKMPDEMIHLAAAMQFIGFRGVVGTLWEMHDGDGPVLAEAFYKRMLEKGWEGADFRDAAATLNEVTRQMKDSKVSLYRIVNFVHIGA